MKKISEINSIRKPELLAPAGNLSCALAAFDAGADAVYCGLKRFNARERTENFSQEEMSKLVAYARGRGGKVYVTFNTLVKESEIIDAAKEISELDRLRPDALIVQDLGVLRILREYFPELTIHGSTQMGLHNSAGLSLAKELGISRVILERQTTVGELERMMAEKPPVELEIFIHGALCCCISGTCLLSSWLGGWSGNRGKCKQPCRRRWHGDDGNGFFLSAQDLCTLEILPRLMKTGVSAFKIEGRLRRPDYVSSVVSAYRMVMDAPSEEAFHEILPVAKDRLSHTCGRRWSLGYYTADSAKNLIKYDNMGVSGLLCGKVTGFAENGFKFEPFRRVYLGDTIRIQPRSGDEGPAICITKMSVNGSPAKSAGKGEHAFIHADKDVPNGGLVYKISERCPDFSKRIEALPLRKTPLDLSIRISRTEFSVVCGGLEWMKMIDLQEASARPLDPEIIAKEFRTMNFESFSVESVRVAVSGNPFLPSSVFKILRNEFREYIEPKLDVSSVRALADEKFRKFLAGYELLRHVRTLRSDCAIVPRGKKFRIPEGTRIVREFPDEPSPREELLLPFFVSEPMISSIRKAVADFIARGGSTVRISSLHHLEFLRAFAGKISIVANMPLPVCNSMSAKELSTLGVTGIQAWIELEKTEMEAFCAKSVLPVEIYTYGRPVLLSTRAEISAKEKMSDMRGEENFRLKRVGVLTQVLPESVLSLPSVRGADSRCFDYRYAFPDEPHTARFNFDHTLE